jgi:hypothetical protein
MKELIPTSSVNDYIMLNKKTYLSHTSTEYISTNITKHFLEASF